FLVGGRFYVGRTTKQQGYGTNGSDANFHYDPDSLKNSDYVFPGMNIALFAENSFAVTKKLKIVPGVRYEYISTLGNGGYRMTNATDNIVDTTLLYENRSYKRSFVLLGLGVSYDVWKQTELYANFSQNYRGITFTDMRVQGLAQRVDPNLRDEKGWNLDIGWRGNINHWFNFDASVYWLEYNNRIGQIQTVDSAYNIYVLTTNIGQSRSLGAELFAQADIFEAAKISKRAGHLVIYVTPSYTNAKYVKSNFQTVVGKFMEFAPQVMLRGGITYSYQSFSTTISANFVSKQYSDATNAERVPSAVTGAIPAYYVMDWNAKYSIKCLQFIAGINNFTNNIYFTRRATSYPGPGIIPAQPLTFYFTLGIKLNEKVKEKHFNTFQ
ncbi:MAG TPA: TonB-dependent receptor, partial [Chitinophagales bacterium]